MASLLLRYRGSSISHLDSSPCTELVVHVLVCQWLPWTSLNIWDHNLSNTFLKVYACFLTGHRCTFLKPVPEEKQSPRTLFHSVEKESKRNSRLFAPFSDLCYPGILWIGVLQDSNYALFITNDAMALQKMSWHWNWSSLELECEADRSCSFPPFLNDLIVLLISLSVCTLSLPSPRSLEPSLSHCLAVEQYTKEKFQFMSLG